jgi:hypothetical protein
VTAACVEAEGCAVFDGVLCIRAFWRAADAMGLGARISGTVKYGMRVAARANDRVGRSAADILSIEVNTKERNEGGEYYYLLYKVARCE